MSTSPFPSAGQSISFGERLASSACFDALFRDGMALVEETAAYLDAAGREEARALPRTAALDYASESMRLTTRLMQMASWLLLQRAVNEGEMTEADAAVDKQRSRLAWQATADAASRAAGLAGGSTGNLAMTGEGELGEARELPPALIELIGKSLRLLERVRHLDAVISDAAPTPMLEAISPLEAQLARLRIAFPG